MMLPRFLRAALSLRRVGPDYGVVIGPGVPAVVSEMPHGWTGIMELPPPWPEANLAWGPFDRKVAFMVPRQGRLNDWLGPRLVIIAAGERIHATAPSGRRWVIRVRRA